MRNDGGYDHSILNHIGPALAGRLVRQLGKMEMLKMEEGRDCTSPLFQAFFCG